MLALILLFTHLAWGADGWWLESAGSPDRAVAAAVESAAIKDGYTARVVKRFRLGEGWLHVALVEGFADEAGASAAGARLRKETGATLNVVAAPAKGKAVKGEPVAAPAAKPAPPSAASTLARCLEAHGGAAGGAAALARSPAVHFKFVREFEVDGKKVRVAHEYWRNATSRRLEVRGGGFGTDSVLVATADGAWMSAAGEVEARDIGVLISQADAFSPEVVLGPALDVPTLFGGPEPGTLMLLEGAESGVRVGRGEDPVGTGFAFADVDAANGLLQRVRYVTDAGPVSYSYGQWRAAREGLVVPGSVRVERADQRSEAIAVEALELLSAAPAGTFAQP